MRLPGKVIAVTDRRVFRDYSRGLYYSRDLYSPASFQDPQSKTCQD